MVILVSRRPKMRASSLCAWVNFATVVMCFAESPEALETVITNAIAAVRATPIAPEPQQLTEAASSHGWNRTASDRCPYTCTRRLIALGGMPEGPGAWQASVTYLFQLAIWMGAGVVEPCVKDTGRLSQGSFGNCSEARWSQYWQVPEGVECFQSYSELQAAGEPACDWVEPREGSVSSQRRILSSATVTSSKSREALIKIAGLEDRSHANVKAHPGNAEAARALSQFLDRLDVKIYVLATKGDPRRYPKWDKFMVPKYTRTKTLPRTPTPSKALLSAAEAVLGQAHGRPVVVAHWRVELMPDKLAPYCGAWIRAAAQHAVTGHFKLVGTEYRDPLFVLLSDAPDDSRCNLRAHNGGCKGWHSKGYRHILSRQEIAFAAA